jgi:hypothetical protein
MAKRFSYNEVCWNPRLLRYEQCKREVPTTRGRELPCDTCGGQSPSTLCCLPTTCCLTCETILGLMQCIKRLGQNYRPNQLGFPVTAAVPWQNFGPPYSPGEGRFGISQTPTFVDLTMLLNYTDFFYSGCQYQISEFDPIISRLPLMEPVAPCYSNMSLSNTGIVINNINETHTQCLTMIPANADCIEVAICIKWKYIPGTQPDSFFYIPEDVRMCINPTDVSNGNNISICERCQGRLPFGCTPAITGPEVVEFSSGPGVIFRFEYPFSLNSCCNDTEIIVQQPQVTSLFGGIIHYGPVIAPAPTYPVIHNVADPLDFSVRVHPDSSQFTGTVTLQTQNCGSITFDIIVNVI